MTRLLTLLTTLTVTLLTFGKDDIFHFVGSKKTFFF
jgi:hypothetical protein